MSANLRVVAFLLLGILLLGSLPQDVQAQGTNKKNIGPF